LIKKTEAESPCTEESAHKGDRLPRSNFDLRKRFQYTTKGDWKIFSNRRRPTQYSMGERQEITIFRCIRQYERGGPTLKRGRKRLICVGGQGDASPSLTINNTMKRGEKRYRYQMQGKRPGPKTIRRAKAEQRIRNQWEWSGGEKKIRHTLEGKKI